MLHVLEWIMMVVLPAGGALVLSVGLIAHLLGQLAPALRVISPPARLGRIALRR